MDDARTTGILIGLAAGGTFAALHGGVLPPDPWMSPLAVAALLAWLEGRRRAGGLARPVPATVDGHARPPRLADRDLDRAVGHREWHVFRRETTDPEGDPAPGPGSPNGGSPGSPSPSSSTPRPRSGAPARPAAREPRDPAADEMERLAEGLEDEGSAGEEISFLPPYASNEASDPAESSGQRGDAWDPLIEAADDEDEASDDANGRMPVPRHFALGTVAVIRKLLEPDDVERILTEQRRYPRLRFGDAAMQLGLLTEPQLQELLLAQQEGMFSEAEIREARDRLRGFRRGGSASPH